LLFCGAIVFSGCVENADFTAIQNTTPPVPQKTYPDTTHIQSTTTSVPLETDPDTSSTDLTVGHANTLFAFEFYKKLSSDPANSGKNMVFSPYSISSAMGVMYEGAQGQTAEEILLVSHLPKNDLVRRQGFSKIHEAVNPHDTNVTMISANAVWVEKSYPLIPEYTRTVQQYYSANATNLGFASHPDDARRTINQWVESNTNNKIHEIISPGDLDAQTTMVFTNSVYFMGPWESPFDKAYTRDANFTVPPNTTVSVKMMAKTDYKANFNYTETSDFRMIEIPYKSANETALSMFILLPVNNNLTAAEDTLSARTFLEMEKNLSLEEKDLYLPRFTIESQEDISGTLQMMGMPTAFTSGADFSKITPNTGIWVKEVTHSAEIEVNEEGTQSAAATQFIYTSGIEPYFIADHPFIFIIQDRESGTILFMGHVINPNTT